MQFFLDLFSGRICQSGPVGEDQSRNSLISVIDLFDNLSSARDFLDVDFVEGDSEIIELALEALAIATPTCRIHREGHSYLHFLFSEPNREAIA